MNKSNKIEEAEVQLTQKQQSYIKDTTDFISFIENTKIGQDNFSSNGRF